MRADRPHVLLRADASARIGTGHVVRCLTLARALVDRGWTAVIVGRMPAELAGSIRDAGVDVRPLPDDLAADAEPRFLDVSGLLDAADVVIVDHYGLAAEWQRAVAGGVRLMVVIDDLAARPQVADLLVNQNVGATRDRYRDLFPAGAVMLAGPAYAILRPAFAEARTALPERSGSVHRILVFLSGADEDDVTRRAAEAAATAGVPVDVVVGSAYPFQTQLLAWARTQPNVRVHVNTSSMPELMAAADLAIGAPGSASWERCTLALPSILVILAENQVEVAGLLHGAGAAVTLGWHDTVTTDQMTEAVAELVADPRRLRAMGRAAAAITDGQGATRVADAVDALLAERSRSRPPEGAAE